MSSSPQPSDATWATSQTIALIAAHQRCLDKCLALLRGDPPVVRSNGQGIMLGLWMRLMQFAAAIQYLAHAGMPSEGLPLARAMLSAYASLAYIRNDKAEERALAYAVHAARMQHRQRTYGAIHGVITPDEARLDDEAQRVDVESAIAAASADGVHLSSTGSRDDTWSGLSERALIEGAIGPSWYYLYRGLSEEAHSGFGAIGHEIRVLGSEHFFGSRSESPHDVLSASWQIFTAATVQIALAFGLSDQGVYSIRAATEEAFRHVESN